jgi:hypothetical protein
MPPRVRRARAFNRRVTVVHYRTTNDPEPRLEEVSREEEVPANVQATPSREDTVNRDQQSQAWNGYFPLGTRLAGQDRVLLDDLVLEVYGAGLEVYDLGGRPHHVEAALRRVV